MLRPRNSSMLENTGASDPVAGQDERLQAARHATVAVAERMDHRQVEVSHGGLDDNRAVVLARALVEHLCDQVGIFLDSAVPRRRSRHGCLRGGRRSPRGATARTLREVVLEHHEVEALEQTLVNLQESRRRRSEGRRSSHRGSPSGLAESPASASEGGLSLDGGDDVVKRGVVALDAVGALDGPGEGHAPQRCRSTGEARRLGRASWRSLFGKQSRAPRARRLSGWGFERS